MMNLIEKLQELNDSIIFSHEVSDEIFNLRINEVSIDFPINIKTIDDYLGYMKPKQWLIHEHQGDSLHEPGLVMLLLLLSEKFKEKKVVFYDIGALYGYFSIIASKIFHKSVIYSVEANPFSCEYINYLNSKLENDKFNIINAFIDNENYGKKYKYISGYRFLEKKNSIFSEYNYIIIKNNIKSFINFFLKNKYQVVHPKKVMIDHLSLDNLIKNNCHDINIMKVDAEGYQAKFLPPASKLMIKNNFILLLEFDDIRELNKFNSSNAEICKPFLDSGYSLYWFDHRIKKPKLKLKNYIDSTMEKNSFGLLMPQIYN